MVTMATHVLIRLHLAVIHVCVLVVMVADSSTVTRVDSTHGLVRWCVTADKAMQVKLCHITWLL